MTGKKIRKNGISAGLILHPLIFSFNNTYGLSTLYITNVKYRLLYYLGTKWQIQKLSGDALFLEAELATIMGQLHLGF